jgi:hypothetical protein
LKPPKRKTGRLAGGPKPRRKTPTPSTELPPEYYAEVRAHGDEIKPEGVSQEVWDELMDDLDRKDAALFAAMMKSVTKYEADVKIAKKTKAKRPSPKTG